MCCEDMVRRGNKTFLILLSTRVRVHQNLTRIRKLFYIFSSEVTIQTKMQLRWTHRLRDYFAEEKVFVKLDENENVASFCAIREVELISEGATVVHPFDDHPPASRTHVATSGNSIPNSLENDAPIPEVTQHHSEQSDGFEDPPSFDKFSRCYQHCQTRFYLRTTSSEKYMLAHTLAKPEFHVADTSLGEMSREGERFDVLWLSETVFMSSVHWHAGPCFPSLCDYQIELSPWHNREIIVFYVYTLSSFTDLMGPRRQTPPSLDPVSYLASMTALLPNDYFHKIYVSWKRSDVPIPLEKFMAIVPTNTDARRRGPLDCTAVTLFQALEPLQLQDILAALSYCEERNLAVRHFLHLKKLDTTINTALRECPHLRHVDIRERFCQRRREYLLETRLINSEVPFTENHFLESIAVEASSWDSVLPLLQGAARNRGLKHLYIFSWKCLHELCPHAEWFFAAMSNVSALQEIIIACRGYERSVYSLSQNLDPRSVPPRTNLCHFSIVITSSGEGPTWPVPAFKKALVNSDLWDNLVSPRLAVNWYSYRLKQNQGRSPVSNTSAAHKERITSEKLVVVPWKVRAVNLGIVYRKTTYHTPHDMSTANASVLFALLYNDIIL
jgi:hypothetical protein